MINILKQELMYLENEYNEMMGLGYSEEDDYLHSVCQKINKKKDEINKIEKEMIK